MHSFVQTLLSTNKRCFTFLCTVQMPDQKEVQRNYRLKHGEELRVKDKERKRLKRSTMTDAQKDDERKKARERMRNKRAKANVVEEVEEDQTAFLSPQSFGKAVARAVKALPQDTGRRIVVLQELCQRDNLTVLHRHPPQFIGNQLKSEVFKVVTDFYLRDDISRQAPGLKDTCYLKDIKQKVSVSAEHIDKP
jgi:hypothetical protein